MDRRVQDQSGRAGAWRLSGSRRQGVAFGAHADHLSDRSPCSIEWKKRIGGHRPANADVHARQAGCRLRPKSMIMSKHYATITLECIFKIGRASGRNREEKEGEIMD